MTVQSLVDASLCGRAAAKTQPRLNNNNMEYKMMYSFY